MRLRRVLISPELIASLLTESCTYRDTETWVTEGLPKGALLVGVAYSTDERAWAFDFFHDSFDEVLEGALPPVFTVIYVRYTFERHPVTDHEIRGH
jgi:hypothetical protein